MFKNWLLLRRAKKKFRWVQKLYLKKKESLSLSAQNELERSLNGLRDALDRKDAPSACFYGDFLQNAANRLMPETFFNKTTRHLGSLVFALVVAIVIRQMWFELFTIPTGSMRPTLKESDVLVVSKTDFGVNVPLQPNHFYFDPSLVKRGSIVVFTGANMDIADSDTMYFGVFPGKKLFVKRLIGKPGDTLYFYGGKIYGIDSSGNEIREFLDTPWFQKLEHIPFIHFDGKVEVSGGSFGNRFSKSFFYQMNQKVAEAETNAFGMIQGKILKDKISDYSDLWGFKNYAMARLLNPEELEAIHPGMSNSLPKGVMYLEITHHPSLKEARLIRDDMHRTRPDLGVSVSLIPLQEEHLNRILSHMTTCRFVVEDGLAYRYGFDGKDPAYLRYLPKLSVPNGTYEIQDGKVSKVYFAGITQEVSLEHPLYSKNPENIQTLYNLGIEFFNSYQPSKQSRLPSRYVYFRDGNLYLMGAPILMKEDPLLQDFVEREMMRQKISTTVHPYFPFVDAKAPMTDEGKFDTSFIRTYGVKVPEKMYLMLGDNHAMSADSRQFGFVPQENLKGGVSFLFSPPGSRFGFLSQPSHAYFGFPNVFVWSVATLITIAYLVLKKRRKERLIQLTSKD